MTRFIAVQHESLAIEADTPQEALDQFLDYLDGMGEWSVRIYDEDNGGDVTP